ncbi:beta-propeller fold lactonase family protein [Jiangella mangrovi]|uniref:6-phosphogluconolactonase (Cycloisomerase 2 family) n=1 Tax=Jiangella mangrovi TaxID=1524084 RepID=A0A7W9GVC7_9ACTN|nr:beta-propeller fold lactonase family protein [Jiangella mangrovi]MBB5790770.1 6-phosphogluconolactonase (cycloisomerase 2 family) [Jiangella mangrovi]
MFVRISAVALAAGLVVSTGIGPGAASPGDQPAASRTLVVGNGASSDVASFAVGADGTPVPTGVVEPTGGRDGSNGVVFAPDGDVAYVAYRDSGRVATYEVGENGELSLLAPPVPTGGSVVFGIAMAPDGRSLYVSNVGSGTVTAFDIAADGTLARRGNPVPTGFDSPRGLVVTPDGRSLYVGHGIPLTEPTNILVRFAIGHDGELRPRGVVAETGGAATGMGITPDGKFLYTATISTDEVYGFRIRPDGRLTALPGSPYAVADHSEGIAISPDGRRLFVASPGQDRPDAGTSAVTAFDVRPNGALRPLGEPVKAGLGPVGITTSPDGRLLFVSNFDSSELSAYRVTSGGLVPTSDSAVPTGGRGPASQSLAIRPNQGPIAAITADVGRAGTVTRFDATGSADPDGRVVRYDWDFGDGTRLLDGGPMPTHVYRSPGVHLARVTVTDSEGCSTADVFTGQSFLCHATAAGRGTETIMVPPRH